MKRLIALMALAGTLAACSDLPTPTEQATLSVRTQSFTQSGNPNGRLYMFWPVQDAFCGMWDTQEQLLFVNCSASFRPEGSGVFSVTYWAEDKILNHTGKAAVYGPTRYPAVLADAYAHLGISPLPDGQMPLCDWNLREYPDAYTTWDLSTMVCTTNWRYTISASGKARAHVIFDPAHTYDPFP